jgi:hypothetical protein
MDSCSDAIAKRVEISVKASCRCGSDASFSMRPTSAWILALLDSVGDVASIVETVFVKNALFVLPDRKLPEVRLGGVPYLTESLAKGGRLETLELKDAIDCDGRDSMVGWLLTRLGLGTSWWPER